MRPTAKVAAVLPLALLGAGCSADEPRPRDARPVAIATTSTDVPLTPRSAARAFSVWTTNDGLARASGDERLALAWALDSQRQVTAAEYRKAAAEGRPVARHSYGVPTLWVPRLEGYPQWFVASVRRDGRPALMAFVKSSAEARWRLDLVALPEGGSRVPAVEVDSDGYATALSSEDRSVLIAPSLVAPPQAAVAEDGPRSYAARVMRPGPYTTGYYADAQKAAKKAAKDGLEYSSTFTATSQPIFSLRTEDGGALVLYSLARTEILTRPEEGPFKVPGEAVHLAVDPKPSGRELRLFHVLRFAAVVPPREPAKPSKNNKGDEPEKNGKPTGSNNSNKSNKSEKRAKESAKVAVVAAHGAVAGIESS